MIAQVFGFIFVALESLISSFDFSIIDKLFINLLMSDLSMLMVISITLTILGVCVVLGLLFMLTIWNVVSKIAIKEATA